MLQKLIRQLKQRRLIARYYWRWLWMSRADRAREKALRKLLFNLLGNAPMEKIMAGESCSWGMTPGQTQGTKEGLQGYVKAVTGEDIKVASGWDAPKGKAKEVSVSAPKDNESCA